MKKKSLAETHPHLLEFWDYPKNNILGIFPNKITHGSHKKVYLKCKKNNEHEWFSTIYHFVHNRRCSTCAGKTINHTNCLETTHPVLVLEWDREKNSLNNLFPDKILAGSHKSVAWICPKCGSGYDAIVKNRTLAESDCPFCSGRKVNHTNCLATTHPHLLDEWSWKENEITPFEITHGSMKMCGWECEKGHFWKASPKERTRQDGPTGCNKCCHKYSSGHEEVVEFIKTFYSGEMIINDTSRIINPETGRKLELDIYFPEKQKAIEYNGTYFHSKKIVQKRDKIKLEECKKKNIELLIIHEGDWNNSKEEQKKKIEHYLY